MNARSRVHEYGGGQTIALGNNGDTITSDFATNTLKHTQQQGAAGQESSQVYRTLSDSTLPYRYADMMLDPCLPSKRGNASQLLVAVREDHTNDTPAQVVNSIVACTVDEASEVHIY